MAFTGKENHKISLKDAATLTKNYRDKQPSGAKKAGFFGRDAIEALLAQPGCVGIRYYYGEEADGKPVLVLVATDEKQNDILPANAYSDDDGEIMQASLPCPPFCPDPPNVLNPR